MTRFFILIVLIGLAYAGYVFYNQSSRSRSFLAVEPPSKITEVADVLGASVTNAIETGTELVNKYTNNQGGPIINRAVEDLQTQIKKYPAQEAEKIKYEFCKGVVVNYESKP